MDSTIVDIIDDISRGYVLKAPSEFTNPRIPMDIIKMILEYVGETYWWNRKALLKLRLVSKSWKSIVDSDPINITQRCCEVNLSWLDDFPIHTPHPSQCSQGDNCVVKCGKALTITHVFNTLDQFVRYQRIRNHIRLVIEDIITLVPTYIQIGDVFINKCGSESVIICDNFMAYHWTTCYHCLFKNDDILDQAEAIRISLYDLLYAILASDDRRENRRIYS